MAASSLKEEIVHQIDRLTPEQQRELLDYARRLQALPAGTPGEVLLAHMENFDFEPGEVDNMMRAIEAACEGIDPNEWK
ncbi:MAG: hypothetical protein IT319_13980 [Anaerolineae bacterium]|nr:hypothetical protein [Anaerolineae bacterium]